jgi:hypothetical protein
MGRVQGGARAAFATLSWGPSRMTFNPYFFATLKLQSENLLIWQKIHFLTEFGSAEFCIL